jgi:hypothetical protein
VERFIDELGEQEREATALTEFGKSRKVLTRIWDNPEDAGYNKL